MTDEKTDVATLRVNFVLYTSHDKALIKIVKWFSEEEIKDGTVEIFVKSLITNGFTINRKRFMVHVPGHAITEVRWGPIYKL